MPLSCDADYFSYLYTCNRCRSCAVGPTPEMKPVCPSYARFGFFTYSGGGKGYVAQGILEGMIKPSPAAAEIAMNCLLCCACASTCPPRFDTRAFIRDLRDHLAGKGFTLNRRHRALLEQARRGRLWQGQAKGGRTTLSAKECQAPAFTGDQEVLVFAGCREAARGELVSSLAAIFTAAGISWGVLENEPCCGAPLLDLGDREAFTQAAGRNIALLNGCGARRVLAICPHCTATLAGDYLDAGDLEPEILSLPRFLAEILGDGRLMLAPGKPLRATFHDPCRLSRYLEEEDEPRAVLQHLDGVEVVEMGRNRKNAWCCGSGAWAAEIVPALARFAARERLAEASSTGAEAVVTACSYCTDWLGKASRGKNRVVHLVDLVAERLNARNDTQGRLP